MKYGFMCKIKKNKSTRGVGKNIHENQPKRFADGSSKLHSDIWQLLLAIDFPQLLNFTTFPGKCLGLSSSK